MAKERQALSPHCTEVFLAMGLMAQLMAQLMVQGIPALAADHLADGPHAIVYPPPGNSSATQQDDAPKTLTLERLYHPGKSFDFDGKLPATHWIGTEESQLLIRRGEVWKRHSLSGADASEASEQSWPVFDRLCENVQALDDVDPQAAIRSVVRVIDQMENETDTVIVRIGDALAVVSAKEPARMLTRDASDWENATLDPTSRRLGYTIKGDLHVIDLATNLTRRLTDDGTDTLLDGELDWTYQEEIFGRGKYRAFWFSPDGGLVGHAANRHQ